MLIVILEVLAHPIPARIDCRIESTWTCGVLLPITHPSVSVPHVNSRQVLDDFLQMSTSLSGLCILQYRLQLPHLSMRTITQLPGPFDSLPQDPSTSDQAPSKLTRPHAKATFSNSSGMVGNALQTVFHSSGTGSLLMRLISN